MEDKKYYTPEIEEFCEGFEYEYSYKGGEWVKEKFSINSGDTDCMAGDWYEFSPNCPQTECRVKYLDKDDLEECGWEYSSDFNSFSFSSNGNDNQEWCLYFLDEKTNEAEITYYGDCVFSGTIKNKSEMKKIMKMINIF